MRPPFPVVSTASEDLVVESGGGGEFGGHRLRQTRI